MNRTTREIESVCEYVCAAEYAYMQINRHNYKEGGREGGIGDVMA
jgi:hypothetical protein